MHAAQEAARAAQDAPPEQTEIRILRKLLSPSDIEQCLKLVSASSMRHASFPPHELCDELKGLPHDVVCSETHMKLYLHKAWIPLPHPLLLPDMIVWGAHRDAGSRSSCRSCGLASRTP